jgi:hypothetical protein
MTTTSEPPSLQPDHAGHEAATLVATIASLRRQMAALEEQVAAITRQQAALRASLNLLLAQCPECPPVENGVVGEPTLRHCAEDIIRVLRELGRPVGALEILDELAARHLSWRESTVRHVLADLKNDGVVREGDAGRSLSYSLAHG